MKKKDIMLGSAIVLVVLLVVGGTMAWFTAESAPVENKFKAGTVEIELVDEFDQEGAQNVNPGDCYDKKVYVKNIGTKRALVRIKKDMVFNRDNSDGKALDIGVVNYELGKGWREVVEGQDVYFYYEDILDPKIDVAGGKTSPLFKDNKVCFDGEGMNNDYQGANFDIKIKAEAIQATNGAPTAEGWKFDPLKDEKVE